MILVDMSVWIDFLTGRDTSFRKELHKLLEEGDKLLLTGLILQEILQGIRSDVEHKKTEKYLLAFPYFSLNEPSVFKKAASIYRTCRQKGKQIRKSMDCLIAAQALEVDAELFHNDKDFTHIAQFFPLKIYKIPL